MDSITFLGVTIDECLNWKLHADLVASKICKLLVVIIRGMKVLLPADIKKLLCTIYSHLTYGIEVWGKTSKSIIGRREKRQKKCVRCVGKAHYLEHTVRSVPLFQNLYILKF